MPYLVFLLLVLGLLLLGLARRTRRATGLPPGRIVALDTLGPRRAGESLYYPVLDLAGRPPYGILQYADQAYAIAYTQELEEELTGTLESMRADLGRSLDRSHASPERCRACGFREDCDQG